MLTDLAERLHRLHLATSPFATLVPAQHARGTQWVQPQLVGDPFYYYYYFVT